MNKRGFLRCLAAVLGGGVLSRLGAKQLAAAESDDKLVNWAGNLQYSTDKLFKAESVAQVQRFVKEHPALKALGTRHCFNGIADSVDQLISLRQMHDPLELDADKRTVTVQAGISYGQLSPWLDQRGFALHNLASLPHISVAGACATGTHGSGNNNGNLSTAAAAVEIVNANGEILELSRDKDGEAFLGAVVHLGAIGIVTKVTLDVEPTYEARQYVYEHMPMSEAYENFEKLTSSGYSVSFFTGWQEMDELWIKVRADADFNAPTEFFGAQRAATNLHPIAELSSENCTEQLGVPGPWYDRLPHFRMGFVPSSGEELQSEYFVARENAVDAIHAVARLHEHIRPHLMISELRTIAADELWMSPCYKRPSLAIHFTWKQDWNAVSKVLPMIERELSPYQVRPHWGKLFTIKPAVLQSRYEKLGDFKELVRTYDPEGKFRNQFLSGNLYG
jgi:xylitol oxidase